MIGYKYNFNGLDFGVFDYINQFKSGTRDWVLTLTEATGFDIAQIREKSREQYGNHGIIDYPSFIGERGITFSGRLVAKSEAKIDEAKEAIKSAFTLPHLYTSDLDGYHNLYFSRQDGADANFCKAKITAFVRFDKTFKLNNVRNFFVSLKCADPFIYSQELFDVDIRHSWYKDGFILPTTLPEGTTRYFNQVVNCPTDGSFSSPPVIKISGELINPKIKNFTTGEEMVFDCTIASGDYYEIDVINRTIVDSNGDSRVGDLDINSDWLWLASGDNEIALYDDRVQSQAEEILPEKLNIQYRNVRI